MIIILQLQLFRSLRLRLRLRSMFDTTILKGIDFCHFRSTRDTKMFRCFATIYHERYPRNGPKQKTKQSTGGPCLPRGSGGHTRPRFTMTTRTFSHHHGKTRYCWIACIIVAAAAAVVVVVAGIFVGIICRGCTTVTSADIITASGRIRRSRGLRQVVICRFFRNKGCDGKIICRLRIPTFSDIYRPYIMHYRRNYRREKYANLC